MNLDPFLPSAHFCVGNGIKWTHSSSISPHIQYSRICPSCFKACEENCDSFPMNKIFIEYCWIWGGQICDRKSHFDNKAKEAQQKQADIKCRFVHLRLWSVTPAAGSKQHSCLAWSKNAGLFPEQQPVCQGWQLKYRSCLNTLFYFKTTHPAVRAKGSRWRT